MVFRSSWSTADLLTVISDKTDKLLTGLGAIPAVALDISKAFHRVWHAGLLQLKSYGISGLMFAMTALGGSGWKVITRISS